LSRLNSFCFKNRVEPAQLDFCLTRTNCPQICFFFDDFFTFGVDPAQPRFLTFGLSRDRGPLQLKQMTKKGVLRKIPYKLCRIASGARQLPPLAARPKLAGWGDSFLMVYRNNTGGRGAGFISVYPQNPSTQMVQDDHLTTIIKCCAKNQVFSIDRTA